MPFLQFIQTGLGRPCTVSAAVKNHHRISKILFALRADEFLAMLEGQIREALFFKVLSDKITVCSVSTKDYQQNILER